MKFIITCFYCLLDSGSESQDSVCPHCKSDNIMIRRTVPTTMTQKDITSIKNIIRSAKEICYAK
jgi:hypothetical protein